MKKEESKLDDALDRPEVCVSETLHYTHFGVWLTMCVVQDGVLVHGLFMEAMRWDDDNMTVVDSRPGEMNPVSVVLCTVMGTIAHMYMH